MPGMVGYISSDRYLHHWVWAHCSGFEEDASAWMDLLIVSPEGKGDIVFGALKYKDKVYRVGGLAGLKFRGDYGLGHLRGETGIKGGAIVFSFTADKKDIIIARYEDPVEGYRYCHNTEVASADITVRTGKLGVMHLTCRGRAFMEIVEPNIIDGSLPRVIEIQ